MQEMYLTQNIHVRLMGSPDEPGGVKMCKQICCGGLWQHKQGFLHFKFILNLFKNMKTTHTTAVLQNMNSFKRIFHELLSPPSLGFVWIYPFHLDGFLFSTFWSQSTLKCPRLNSTFPKSLLKAQGFLR